MKEISVVIPCYRSENTIEGVVARVEKTLKDKNFEIILVNDGSPDNTWKVIKHISKHSDKVIAINLARNFGQHSAIFAGLRMAEGESVVCLDDDGQTPPEAIPDLLNAIDGEYDVAYAKYSHKMHSKFRNFGSRVNDWMACTLLGKPKSLFLSSYFAAKRYVVDEMLRYTNPYVYLPGLVLRTTNRICNVDVCHSERTEGVSGYSFTKLIILWMNGFTAFSVLPLRIADLIGSVLAASGFVYMVYTVISAIINPSSVAGWSSLMSVLLMIGGFLMLMIGMVGEYIGRLYISLNNSPQYVVRNIEASEKDKEKVCYEIC